MQDDMLTSGSLDDDQPTTSDVVIPLDYYGFNNITGSTTPFGDPPVARAFESCVICVGLIGTAANGMVLTMLAQSKLGKHRTTNTFILNQLLLDFFSCLLLLITYAWKLSDTTLDGNLGAIVCFFIGSEGALWVGLNGSIANLVFITLERYVKIVHPIWHRQHYRNWMTYTSCTIPWISGILINFPSNWIAGDFADGHCQAYSKWANPQDGIGYGIFFVVVSFVIPMSVFVFCYGKILFIIRRRSKIASDPAKYETADSVPRVAPSKNRSEMAIIKTMILITILFAVCWSPNNVYFILLNTNRSGEYSVTSDAWYGTMFAAFLTNCLHPFIYGSKIDEIRIRIENLFRKKKISIQSTGASSHKT